MRQEVVTVFYPLTVRDFLDRAEQVYPDRIAIVDEPTQPAPSLGSSSTTAGSAALARAQAARLDQLGVPVGGRVAVISQNSARLLTSFFGVSGWGRALVPINFRLSAGRDRVHRRAQRRRRSSTPTRPYGTC